MSLKTKPTILVCDDEEGIRESFKLILENHYDLQFATNGLEAVDMLKQAAPDAMLLDIKMPKVHSMEILKQIKKLKPNLAPRSMATGSS